MKKVWMVYIMLVLLAFTGCANEAVQTNEMPDKEVVETAVEEEIVVEESNEWPKTIVDAKGTTIVLEKAPERITLLHTFYAEHFFLLGQQPTAIALGNASGQVQELADSEMYAPYLTDVEIMDIGKASAINLEKIIESEPDVIITYAIHRGVDEIYEQLSAIAPVILLNHADSWQEQLRSCADIIGENDKAEEAIASIELSIASSKEIVSGYEDRTFALFRTNGKGFVPRANGVYFDMFGLKRPEAYPDGFDALSLEGVAEMDPYYMVFQHNYEASQAFIDSMADSTVWQSLEAVKNNRIYFFDENMNTLGPLAMKLTAEKLLEIYSE